MSCSSDSRTAQTNAEIYRHQRVLFHLIASASNLRLIRNKTLFVNECKVQCATSSHSSALYLAWRNKSKRDITA